MHSGNIQRNFDLVTGTGCRSWRNTSNQVGITRRKIQVNFSTHQLCHINIAFDDGVGDLKEYINSEVVLCIRPECIPD